MIKKNFHTHTRYCRHSNLTPGESVKLHTKMGYTTLGISEHVPVVGYEDRYRLQLDEVDNYIKDVKDASVDADIEVLCGFESEYIVGHKKQLEYLKTLRKRCDYMVLANHIVGDFLGDDFVHFSRDVPKGEDLIKNALLLEEGWATGLFAFIAHPDSILKNYQWDSWAEKMSHMIGTFAEKTGALLEINANGIRCGNNRTEKNGTHAYTNLNFWKIVSEYNVNVIISGDTHHTFEVGHSSEELACNIAKELKLNVISDFRDI